MEFFADYLAGIDNPEHRTRLEEILRWIMEKYPSLKPKIGWNQPMFTDHGTFIIGFSLAKKHMAVAPEQAGINHFSEEIVQAGYEHSKELMRIRWDQPVNYDLLAKLIEYNMSDKAAYSSFWRK